jgi:hypothetical protein
MASLAEPPLPQISKALPCESAVTTALTARSISPVRSRSAIAEIAAAERTR